MEPWLLAVGAALLVGIAIWLVTRDEKPDAEPLPQSSAGSTPEQVPVISASSTEPSSSAASVRLPATEAAMDTTIAQTEPLAPTPIEPVTPPRAAHSTSFASSETSASRGGASTTVAAGIGAGTIAVAATAIGGVLWYRRWQAERNKPINRFRRRARALYSDVRERVPDTSALMDYLASGDVRRPATGAGSLALVATLLLLRALRERGSGDTIGEEQADAIASTVAEAIQQAEKGKWEPSALLESARTVVQPALSRALHDAADRVEHYGDESHAARNAGLGLVAALGLGAVGYLAWRAFGRGGETGGGPDWLPVQPNS